MVRTNIINEVEVRKSDLKGKFADARKLKDKREHQIIPDFKPQKQPIRVYKQFKLRLDKNGRNLAPGMVFPLYVDTDTTEGTANGLQIGKWYKSGVGEVWVRTDGRLYTIGNGTTGDKDNRIPWLALRSGWHTTNTPWGNQRGTGITKDSQFGNKNNYQNTRDNEVWALVELSVDNDATEAAMEAGRQREKEDYEKAGKVYNRKEVNPVNAYLHEIGDNMYYLYKTNSNASDDQTWYIADMMRIVKVLDDDSVDNINDEFYSNLSKKTGRNIDSDPWHYRNDSNDIPYWKMPRQNGVRYSSQDLSDMGYEPMSESFKRKLVNAISEDVKRKLKKLIK